MKYTEPGAVIELASRAQGATLIIDVRDAGQGIADDTTERIFAPFGRADAARSRNPGGVGLGLAIVDAIAKARGGKRSLRTSAAGSTFSLALPGFTARTAETIRFAPADPEPAFGAESAGKAGRGLANTETTPCKPVISAWSRRSPGAVRPQTQTPRDRLTRDTARSLRTKVSRRVLYAALRFTARASTFFAPAQRRDRGRRAGVDDFAGAVSTCVASLMRAKSDHQQVKCVQRPSVQRSATRQCGASRSSATT